MTSLESDKPFVGPEGPPAGDQGTFRLDPQASSPGGEILHEGLRGVLWRRRVSRETRPSSRMTATQHGDDFEAEDTGAELSLEELEEALPTYLQA